MSNIQFFSFEGNEVRFVGTVEAPEWIAQDVCNILELGNVSKALTGFKETEKGAITTSDSMGREQTLLTLKEPGLYKLIFKSRKPSAERFQDWVFTEVLPSIRKNKAYIAPEAKTENIIAAMTPEQRIDLVSKGIAVLEKLGQVTDWDRQMLADQVRNALGGIESKAHEKTFWTVCERAEELGMKLTSGQLSRVGRLAARAYRERYNTEPLKTTRMVNGSSTHVFGYAREDIGLVDDALSYETKAD